MTQETESQETDLSSYVPQLSNIQRAKQEKNSAMSTLDVRVISAKILTPLLATMNLPMCQNLKISRVNLASGNKCLVGLDVRGGVNHAMSA